MTIRWKKESSTRFTAAAPGGAFVEVYNSTNAMGYWSWWLRVEGKEVAGGGCADAHGAKRAAERALAGYELRQRTRLTPAERQMLLTVVRRWRRTGEDHFPWADVQTALHKPAQPAHLHYAQVARTAKKLADKGLIVSGDVGDEFGSLTPTGKLWAR